MPKKDRTKSVVGDKTYQHSDYHSNDQLSKGMAETHEQVSESYMEGSIEEHNITDGKDGKLPRE